MRPKWNVILMELVIEKGTTEKINTRNDENMTSFALAHSWKANEDVYALLFYGCRETVLYDVMAKTNESLCAGS